jgi:hypothetical protein
MPNITIPDITIRTTSDGEGYVHGLAHGTGSSATAAIWALAASARRQAQIMAVAALAQAAAPHGDEAVEFRYGEDTLWRFEVIDVRLVAGSEGDEAWCAIGTLRSEGARPGAASYWQGR